MKKAAFTTLLIILLASCGSFKITTEWAGKTWYIGQYSILYSKKTGWAGPPFYTYDVYKGGHYVSHGVLQDTNPCMLRFEENRERCIYFNLCNGTKILYADDKVLLDAATIDSVIVRGNAGTLRLTPKEIKKYVKMWNKAKANGFKRLGAGYDYQVVLYTKRDTRKMQVLNNYVTEDGNWSYHFEWNIFF
jgi:hypothetical protein